MKTSGRIYSLFTAAFALAYCAVMLEVLFQFSKGTFLSRLEPLEFSFLIVNSIVLFTLPVLFITVVLGLLVRVFPSAREHVKRPARFVLSLAVVALGFAHADTLAYSALALNVSALPMPVNLALLAFLIFAACRLSGKAAEGVLKRLDPYTRLLGGVFVLMAFVTALSVFYYSYVKFPHITVGNLLPTERKLPDIIIFSSDGLDSKHLGLYGYGRETTPFLTEFSKSANVYTRAYTNSGNTMGSITSILTGKYPISTKVNYIPDILLGQDAFEHLPGMLADLGYYTIGIGDGEQFSPDDLNIEMGFHVFNAKKTSFTSQNRLIVNFMRIFNTEIFFLKLTADRVVSRPMFMLGLSQKLVAFKSFMKNLTILAPHKEVSKEDEHLESFIDFLGKSDKPVFAYIHSIRTHGPIFNGLRTRKFSRGMDQSKAGPTDAHYDDAILTVDIIFKEIIDIMKGSGRFEDSMVFFLSDHGRGGENSRPLPLVVRFPGQKTGRVIDQPLDYLDIAPSILNTLGITVPRWMEGNPAITENPRAFADKRIFSFYFSGKHTKDGILHVMTGPPLYGIGSALMVKDGRLFQWDLINGTTRLSDVSKDPFNPIPMDNNRQKLQDLNKTLSLFNERGFYMDESLKVVFTKILEHRLKKENIDSKKPLPMQ